LPRRVADLGLQVVLATSAVPDPSDATSAPEDELEILRTVPACDDVIAATTSSRDVDTAKPAPHRGAGPKLTQR